MKHFFVSKNKQFVIYGAGGDCRRLIAVLRENNYQVVFIIDKRADSIVNLEGVPVVTFDELNFDNIRNCIFIISIKNVFEHTLIAKELLSRGVQNLVYKPLPVLHGTSDSEWEGISRAYDQLLIEKRIPKFPIAISRRDHMMAYYDQLFISENQDVVLCFMPIELIHNYNTDEAYGKMHMAAYYPLVDLYKYLLAIMPYNTWDGVKEQYYLYSAEWVSRVGEKYTLDLKKSLIHSRIGAFEEMQKLYDIEKDFFTRNAVNVEIGENKQFYLKSSGRNRVAFLIAKGCNYVPVKMDKESYRIWLDEEKSKRIIEFLEINHINKMFCKVPHPILSSYPTDVFDYSRLFCMPVISRINSYLHKLAEENDNDYPQINYEKFLQLKKDIKIYCDIDDMGNMGRYIAAAGMKCTQVCENSAEITALLDDLFNYRDSALIVRNCKSKKADCHIYITDFLHLDNLKTDITFSKIYSIDLSGNENTTELLEGKGFYKTVLFETVWNEKKMVGVEWSKQTG